MDGEALTAQEQSTQSALVELGRILHGTEEPAEAIATVVRLAHDMVPNADEVSLTLIKDETPYTAGSTGETAALLDEEQYRVGYSPSLDSAVSGQTIAIADTAAEDLYTAFATRAQILSVGSVLSVGLPVPHDNLGALTLYAHRPGEFDPTAVFAAQTFAAAAAVTLANRTLYVDAVQLAQQLQQAMLSRATIEQAKGILMRDNRCSPEDAFSMLIQSSARSQRKLRDIAVAIVEGTQLGR